MSRTTSSDRPRRGVGAGGVGVGPAVLVACRWPSSSLGRPWRIGRQRCVGLCLPCESVGARGGTRSAAGGRGCGWCRRARRGPASRGAARARRAAGRRPRSRPRTAGGTPRRRAAPGSDPGTAARRPPGRHRAGARGVPVGGQRRRRAPRRGRRRRARRPRHRARSAPRARGPAARRSRSTASGPTVLGQEAQRRRGQVVVLGGQRRVPGVGQRRTRGPGGRGRAGRPAPAPAVDQALGLEVSRCRRTAARVRPSRSASSLAVTGPVLEHRPGHPVAGCASSEPSSATPDGCGRRRQPTREIHNTSVT